jgi:hypothetical protein
MVANKYLRDRRMGVSLLADLCAEIHRLNSELKQRDSAQDEFTDIDLQSIADHGAGWQNWKDVGPRLLREVHRLRAELGRTT